MTLRDRAVVGGLAILLVVLAAAIAWPSLGSTAGVVATGTPTPAPEPPYREGMVGRPSAVSPFAASTAADRAIVRLAFSGLVRLGPDGTMVPDLAERWTVDDARTTWTFYLRPDATWHDGQPVTARDVVFTIRALQSADYTGPGAGSWRDVSVDIVDDRTVRFVLGDPIGGFLDAAAQPIAPEHLLGDVPVELLPTHPFNQQPVGSGPYRVVSWSAGDAILEAYLPGVDGSGDPRPDVTPAVDTLVSPTPTERPAYPVPYIRRLELRFFSTPAELAEALQAGEIHAAAGLPAGDAVAVGADPDLRLIRYPTTTLTAVVFDLRTTRPTFRDARVRRGLLAAIDRDRLVSTTMAGLATRADAPIPPGSWAFDAAASTPIAYDPTTARKLLGGGGWKAVEGGWTAPGVSGRYTLELLTPSETTNRTTHAVAEAVASDWRALGIEVTVVDLEPADLAARLEAGDFEAAVVDLAIGLDPDLYPLLASTQTLSGGANVSGLQDPQLDGLLEAARRPGDQAQRMPAFSALEAYLATSQPILPLAFRDEVVLATDALEGPTPRLISETADRFYDVVAWRLANGR